MGVVLNMSPKGDRTSFPIIGNEPVGKQKEPTFEAAAEACTERWLKCSNREATEKALSEVFVNMCGGADARGVRFIFVLKGDRPSPHGKAKLSADLGISFMPWEGGN